MDDKTFYKISKQVEADFNMGGLAGTIFEDYARECTKRYLQAAINGIEYCPACGHPLPKHKSWCRLKGIQGNE